MAYRDRQAGKTILGEMPSENYDVERKAFYMSDYEGWQYKDDFSFQIFCFLIKGLPENTNETFLRNYAATIVNDNRFYEQVEESNHPIGKEFKKFQELFFQNKYQIKNERLSEKMQPINQN
ncbi:hypothetical protein ACFOW1_03590 [Parasediminibacterium paludis]|uniref:Uncharacterized protein n=1 Tax=Parasediminibacterium paludis TaxID=908966 RepID=A0ABV8PSU2_9BACT